MQQASSGSMDDLEELYELDREFSHFRIITAKGQRPDHREAAALHARITAMLEVMHVLVKSPELCHQALESWRAKMSRIRTRMTRAAEPSAGVEPASPQYEGEIVPLDHDGDKE